MSQPYGTSQPYTPPTPAPRAKRSPVLIAGIAAAVCVALGIGVVVGSRFVQGGQLTPAVEQGEDGGSQMPGGTTSEKRVIVPDLSGMAKADAEKALKDAGLVAKAGEAVFDEQVPADHVVSQSPKAGDGVKADTTVTYTLSKGKETFEIPDVVGRERSTAVSLLEDAGFTVDVSYAESSSYSEGVVMSQSESGRAQRGTTVSITVSTGVPEPEPVPEPESAPVQRSNRADSFPRVWAGSYEGTNGSEFVSRPVRFVFDSVSEGGALSGSCEITVVDDDGTTTSSYRVDGYVDWDTGEFMVSGTQWINNAGGFTGMRSFSGYVYDNSSISGSTWNAQGETSSWSVYAS